MKCTNCGSNFTDGLLQCPLCGTKVESYQQSSAEFNSQQPYGQQNQQFEQQGQAYNQNNTNFQQGFQQQGFQQIGNAPEFVLFIILGILYCICCCNIVVGIPGIIFTVMMNNAYKIQNMLGYNNNKKIAKWIYIIGIILMVVGTVLNIIFGFTTGLIDYIRYY